MDTKLAILIVLFGMIIALSHLSAERIERIKERIGSRRWRKPAPITDKI